MITSPLRDLASPRINMYVLHLRASPRDRLRYEHMIDLLRMLLVHVRVPLHRVDVRHLVYIRELSRERLKHGSGLSVFVHIAGHDDVGVGVSR